MRKFPSIGFDPKNENYHHQQQHHPLPPPPPFHPPQMSGVPPGRLYPNIGPPGTVAVQSPAENDFITLRESLENAPLPPIAQQQQQQLFRDQLPRQPLQFPPTVAPPPYHDHFVGPAAGAGGIGVRYLVHGSPQTQEIHAVHAVPSGAATGGDTLFYYISSSSVNNFRGQELPDFLFPHRRCLSYTFIAIFTAIVFFIMFFFFKMHSKFSEEFNQRYTNLINARKNDNSIN